MANIRNVFESFYRNMGANEALKLFPGHKQKETFESKNEELNNDSEEELTLASEDLIAPNNRVLSGSIYLIGAISAFILGSLAILFRSLVYLPQQLTIWYLKAGLRFEKPDREKSKFPNFDYWSHRIIGMPFLIIGFVCAIPFTLLYTALFIPIETALSFERFFMKIVNLSLIGTELEDKENNVDQRHFVFKGFGLLGGIPAILFGVIVAAIIATSRLLFNIAVQSYYSVVDAIYFIANFIDPEITIIDPEDQKNIGSIIDNAIPERNFFEILLGAPGTLVGIGLTILFIPLSYLILNIAHTSIVFAVLCNKYWSFAWGLSNDPNNQLDPIEKRFSVLGLVMSSPFAILSVAVRIFGFLGSAIYRGVSEASKVLGTNKLRLENRGNLEKKPLNEPNPRYLTETEHEIFRILYANKCPITGRVQWIDSESRTIPSSLIIPPSSGHTESGGNCAQVLFNGNNVIKFFRKALTYNRQTLHEQALNQVYINLTAFSSPKATIAAVHTPQTLVFNRYSFSKLPFTSVNELCPTSIDREDFLAKLIEGESALENLSRPQKIEGLIDLALIKVYQEKLSNDHRMSKEDENLHFSELMTLRTLLLNLLVNKPMPGVNPDSPDDRIYLRGRALLWPAPKYDDATSLSPTTELQL